MILTKRTLLSVAAIGIALSSAFTGGWAANGWRYQEKIAVMERDLAGASQIASERAREVERLQTTVSEKSAEMAILAAQKRKVIEKVVTEEVIKYVENPDAGRCVMPDQWVRIHNIAATGEVPEATEPASNADAGTGTITDIETLVTVKSNYGTCRETRDQLIGLQKWVRSINLQGEIDGRTSESQP